MTDFSENSTRSRRERTVESYRDVAAIVLALTVLQAAIGGLSVVGPLTLLSQGASTLKIGTIVTGYALGFMLGAHLAPREILRIGHIRAVAAFAAAASIAAALLYANDALAWWLVMQFIMGLCVAGFLASGESWIADAAPHDNRGAILGFYLVTSKLGFIAGPFLVSSVPPGSAAGFLIVAALFTASLIPVSATNRGQPAPPSVEPFGALKVWRTAPSAIIAAFIAGLVNGAVLQLYSVFVGGFDAGSVARTAALFNAFMIGGSVIAQWPAGMISDRIDRRIVIAGLALVSGAAALTLAFFSGVMPRTAVFILAAVWGAGALSYYGVAVAHAADRAAEGEATSMMSGILMIWALGSMIGPLSAGAVMNVAGASGLFLFAAVALIALAAIMLFRRTGKAPVLENQKGDFEPTSATSVAVYELTEIGSEEAENLDGEDPYEDDRDEAGMAAAPPEDDEETDERYWER
ncbi:MFS transporter [Maricaulis sp.]|uniref:MFS transporter n=1 Tax=Maricaulis sp. TaxID=1486257 RepID=UPI00263A3CCA|nr:MFS transporter [Maricaulis sp.]